MVHSEGGTLLEPIALAGIPTTFGLGVAVMLLLVGVAGVVLLYR